MEGLYGLSECPRVPNKLDAIQKVSETYITGNTGGNL